MNRPRPVSDLASRAGADGASAPMLLPRLGADVESNGIAGEPLHLFAHRGLAFPVAGRRPETAGTSGRSPARRPSRSASGPGFVERRACRDQMWSPPGSGCPPTEGLELAAEETVRLAGLREGPGFRSCGLRRPALD